ncbi:hypothetical protein [Streptomyces chartreusis]|uniref:hypothetical protein n=1 Tax=Streptomyces chartreusis TaxID=1969 RepID=UPI00123CCA3A|nr:hypothetical protein [Streptomyces chartreusis]QEV66203.1 hypothetical protein CP983_05695 [Streptomyces chartreusis]GGW98636.1 hypothetical protein GCM10010321_11270 [Streptomyces chartreusis]
MGQQISVEDAFPTFQKRCRELFEENMLLRAQVDVLERRVAALEEENAGALPAAQAPTIGDSEPAPTDGQRAESRY